MAITSEIIGKLGGAEVDAISVSAPSKTGSTVLTQIDVPPGKTVLVAVKGQINQNSSSGNLPTVLAAGVGIGGGMPNSSTVSGVTTLTTSSSIAINIAGVISMSFSGTVYTVEM